MLLTGLQAKMEMVGIKNLCFPSTNQYLMVDLIFGEVAHWTLVCQNCLLHLFNIQKLF